MAAERSLRFNRYVNRSPHSRLFVSGSVYSEIHRGHAGSVAGDPAVGTAPGSPRIVISVFV